MAYTSRDFLKDLAIYSTGAALGIKNSVKFAQYAAKKGIQLAGVSAPRVAQGAAGIAQTFPRTTGVGVGLAALETPQGQALLEAAAERGRMDRVRAQQMLDEFVFRQVTQPAQQAADILESPTIRSQVKRTAKRKVSKYAKAVKAGMSAVKMSKFNGKKGKINNAKKTFATVNRVASAVNKGKKVSAKGVTGTIARAVRKIL